MSSEDEEGETEEHLTADSYGAVDISLATDDFCLIHIPQKLAHAWDSLPEGAELGELVFTKGGPPPAQSAKAAEREAAKPSVTVHVAESVAESFKQQSQQKAVAASRPGVIQTSNALPLNYSLQAMTKKIPLMHPFTRNPRTGSVKLWGTVTRTANLQVEKDEQYRAMLKDRLVTTNINNQRYVKPVEATESVLSKQRNISGVDARKKSFGDAVLQFGKRKLEAAESSAMAQRQQGQQGGAAGANSKKARQFAPDQSIRSVVFELFAQNKFWAVKDLKQAAVNGGAVHAGTRKGESEIRDILREIGDYHRSGDHKNMWELRQEFQQQN